MGGKKKKEEEEEEEALQGFMIADLLHGTKAIVDF
jgi:hypothetical protein